MGRGGAVLSEHRIHIFKTERLLTDADRKLVRDLWREKLRIDQEIIDVSLQMIDLKEREDELRTEAITAMGCGPGQREELYKIKLGLDRLSAIKSELTKQSDNLSSNSLSRKFDVSKTSIYYIVHAR